MKLILIFLSLLVVAGTITVVIKVSRHRSSSSNEFVRNAGWFLNNYEKRQQVTVPANIDDEGIRKLVAKLLTPTRGDFAAEKLELLAEKAVPSLVEVLKDPRFWQKPKTAEPLYASAPVEAVLKLLQPFGPPAAIEPLSAMLKHPDKYFRQQAALALANIAENDCIEPMKLALADSEDYVRAYAMMGIGWAFKYHRGSPEFLQATFDMLIPLLNKKDQSLSQAARTLLVINREKGVPIILQDRFFNLQNPILVENLRALNEQDVVIPEEDLRRLMKPIEENLEKYPNNSIFGECLIALARTRSPTAEETIKKALDGANKQIAERAAEAMPVLKGVSKVTKRVFIRMDEVGFENLNQPEKVVASVEMMINEVNNGGFDQYFFNSSGDYAAQTLAGLKEIDARDTEEILTKSMALFGRKGPSSDRTVRIKQLENFSKSSQAQLSDLDERFYKKPDNIEMKLYLYVAEHSDSFKD